MATAAAGSALGHTCRVFAAVDVFVVQGANQGDGLAGPDEVCPGDIYRLTRDAEPVRLVVSPPQGGLHLVCPGSQAGAAGALVWLEACYALMAPDGDRVDLVILRLDPPTGAAERYILPLTPIGPGVEYTLVSVDPVPEDLHLADLLGLSFARGTMITLTDGSQRAIEALAPGVAVLTRDHGRQTLRWIGQARLRAVGAFAPVVIPAGTLGNAGDLIVSQQHRVFLYQPHRLPGLPTAEVLVRAGDLVDGTRVYLRTGGFVDYFSLVFDHHEIIYAEGVPCESLMVNEATVNRLPPEVAAEVRARFPGLAQVPHFGTEASREVLDDLGAAGLIGARRT